jgi:hypothetical protein
MWQKTYLGPHPISRGVPHQGQYEWIHRFKREERHRLVDEDRSARNSVLLVLATAMLGGMGVLITTLVWFIAR